MIPQNYDIGEEAKKVVANLEAARKSAQQELTKVTQKANRIIVELQAQKDHRLLLSSATRSALEDAARGAGEARAGGGQDKSTHKVQPCTQTNRT